MLCLYFMTFSFLLYLFPSSLHVTTVFSPNKTESLREVTFRSQKGIIIKKDKMLTQTSFFSSPFLPTSLSGLQKPLWSPGHPSFLLLPFRSTCQQPPLSSLLLIFPIHHPEACLLFSGSLMSVFRVTLCPSFTFSNCSLPASRRGTNSHPSPHLSSCFFFLFPCLSLALRLFSVCFLSCGCCIVNTLYPTAI